jgi:hypothetical protein
MQAVGTSVVEACCRPVAIACDKMPRIENALRVPPNKSRKMEEIRSGWKSDNQIGCAASRSTEVAPFAC